MEFRKDTDYIYDIYNSVEAGDVLGRLVFDLVESKWYYESYDEWDLDINDVKEIYDFMLELENGSAAYKQLTNLVEHLQKD